MDSATLLYMFQCLAPPRWWTLVQTSKSTGSLMEIMIPNAKREMQAQMHNNARMQDEVASCNT